MARKSLALTQVNTLQSLTFAAASLIGQDIQETKDKCLRGKLGMAVSSLVKSFDTLEDRKRILKGKPMPGSLRPEGPKTKRKGNNTRLIAQEPEQSEPSKESLSPQPSTEPGTGEGNGAG